MSDIEKQPIQDFANAVNLIRETRSRVFSYANKQLVSLYWEFGRFVSAKVSDANWGKGVVKQLADYIQKEEPGVKGFSDKNIWRMKQFYETYKDNEKLSTLLRVLSWSHNCLIISRCKTEEEREFYLRLASAETLSFRELDRQISSSLYERSIADNKKLSPVVRVLHPTADKIFKDKYIFEFLDLPHNHDESDLRRSLVANLKKFILELGRDFAFVGEEYRVQVGNSDFFIDLLFFHRELQCLVAFELKIDKFKPEFLGKLEFYLEALDRDVRKSHEKPSIGVLLCKDKDDEVVEYALSRSVSPAVIAQYETKLIPKELLRNKLHEFAMLAEDNDDKTF
jgi:predicted nuclease of restriction endonuclease-like (RecB) superfamily